MQRAQGVRTKAILLDALGTLVALEPPAPRLRLELARLGIEVTAVDAAEAIAAEIRYYRAHLDEGRDPESLRALRERCAEVLRAALPARVASELPLAAATSALLAALRFAPFPDVRPALAALRAGGHALVVVSNWDVSLHSVLARLRVVPLLDAVLTSAEAGARKPSPLIFERALELAGASAQDALHVGDSIEEDVRGARAAGIQPVLLRRDGGMSFPGVRTITTLTELADEP
jgi:putative hydrolase of the HAD superfamily